MAPFQVSHLATSGQCKVSYLANINQDQHTCFPLTAHTLHPIVLRLLPLLFCQRKKKMHMETGHCWPSYHSKYWSNPFHSRHFDLSKLEKHRWNIHYNNHDDCISFRWAISRDLVLFMLTWRTGTLNRMGLLLPLLDTPVLFLLSHVNGFCCQP